MEPEESWVRELNGAQKTEVVCLDTGISKGMVYWDIWSRPGKQLGPSTFLLRSGVVR